MRSFSGTPEQISEFYMYSNGNIIVDLRNFTIQTVYGIDLGIVVTALN
jgi:hypothetical protein